MKSSVRDLEHKREEYALDPEKFRARVRRWQTANPVAHRESVKAWVARNPEKRRFNSLKSGCLAAGIAVPGMTQERFVAWFRERDTGSCECCSAPISGKDKSVDHGHVSGEVRGIVCRRCNTSAGLIANPERWLAVGRYMGWSQ